VQGIPASLDSPAKADFSSRLLTQFNAVDTSKPAATPTQVTTTVSPVVTSYNNVDYNEYVLPDDYSLFLIKIGLDGDNQAERYNTLLQYTKGLLKAIDQSNQVSVVSPK